MFEIRVKENIERIDDVLNRLEVLSNKLESEGQYVRRNTVELAYDLIREMEHALKELDK